MLIHYTLLYQVTQMNLQLNYSIMLFKIKNTTTNIYTNSCQNQILIQSKTRKKILGCSIEKTGENMIALAPKCYTKWNSKGQTKSLKLKGVSIKKNIINSSDYKSIIEKNSVKQSKT